MNEQIIPIPSALITPPRAESDYVAGVSSQIVYAVNVPNGDWTPYLPSYEPQKFRFDTNECSQLSGINVAETICNWLKATNQLSEDALNWFTANGYFDDSGSFAFSERFSGILSGTSINGGSQWSFWQTASKNGFLPRKDLNYTLAQSVQFGSQAAMCADYYNSAVVTPAMRQKALQSLEWLNIQYEWVGDSTNVSVTPALLSYHLKQSPLHIGVPVCVDGWNQTMQQANIVVCNKKEADHAIELFNFAPNGSGRIRDHYNPYDKTLAPGYFIPLVTKGVITVTPEANKVVIQDIQTEVTLLQRIINIITSLRQKMGV